MLDMIPPKKESQIGEKRKEIDKIDAQIVRLLAKRFLCSQHIAEQKQYEGLPVVQKAREKEVIRKCSENGEKSGLQRTFIQKIFNIIILESRKVQKREEKASHYFDKKGKI